jgi:two-component system NtrC family sensor kinase
VADTGSGISPEVLSKIAEPFYTTKAATKAVGTGLGLTVSYKIIQEHQGTISVQSELGQGTTFTILLPVQQRDA